MIQRLSRPWLRVIAIGLGIAAAGVLVVFVIRGAGSTAPGGLRIGDCFDVPPATNRIGDVRVRSCGGPHDGEVFHMFTTERAASDYPSDADWESIIYPVCDPAFESYTGTLVAERLDIDYRYFVPTADRWTSGDRGVTCYITSLGESPLDRSFRATAP
jgi:hypothetical protein